MARAGRFLIYRGAGGVIPAPHHASPAPPTSFPRRRESHGAGRFFIYGGRHSRTHHHVIPAQPIRLDSRLRGNDGEGPGWWVGGGRGDGVGAGRGDGG